jgi:hypothetical protein
MAMIRFSQIPLLVLCLLVTTQLGSIEIEHTWGFYRHQSQGFSIEFLLDGRGVSRVKVNSKDYPGKFKLAEERYFGKTAFYRIYFKHGRPGAEFVDLLVLFDRRGVHMASGYYADLEFPDSHDGSYIPQTLKAIEMKVTPLDEYKKWKHK